MIYQYRKKILSCAATLALCLSVTGCEVLLGHKAVLSGLALTSQGIFHRPDVNLKAKNYAAADYLIGKTQATITYHDLIAIQPLYEKDNAGISSDLGRNIPMEIGLRFAELGYSVNLSQLDHTQQHNTSSTPHYTLSGTYRIDRPDIHVSLRMIDARTHRLLTQFDYTMPLTSELRTMAETTPRIFRVE